MSWFDGTYTRSAAWLEEDYPNKDTEDLRVSANGSRLALINHFREGDPLLDLSDPRADEDEYGRHVFYHTFIGDDAGMARSAFAYYCERESWKSPKGLALFRQEGDRLFQYGYGYVCRTLLDRQDELQKLLPESYRMEQDVFMLPLKRYMYSCPVCWQRTLPFRGDFIICPECHWEDDGTDRIDNITLPNGDYTIRSYKKEYLKKTGKMM